MGTKLTDYASGVMVRALCDSLCFQPDVAEDIITCLSELDLAAFDPYFEGLFSISTGDAAVKAILSLCETEGDAAGSRGLKALSIYLAAALHTRELYEGLGIGDRVYLDTMKGFRRFMIEYKYRNGGYGFDDDFWIYRQLSAKLFRLGILEFELLILPEDFGEVGGARAGDPVLSVHIPSDAVMTREALDESYCTARVFFAQYFPEFLYKCVYCGTWLLSPVLEGLLKPASHIRNFRSDYVITFVNVDDNSGARWLFPKGMEDLSEQPGDSSLTRAMKRHLLLGGKIGVGAGYVKNFQEKSMLTVK